MEVALRGNGTFISAAHVRKIGDAELGVGDWQKAEPVRQSFMSKQLPFNIIPSVSDSPPSISARTCLSHVELSKIKFSISSREPSDCVHPNWRLFGPIGRSAFDSRRCITVSSSGAPSVKVWGCVA